MYWYSKNILEYLVLCIAGPRVTGGDLGQVELEADKCNARVTFNPIIGAVCTHPSFLPLCTPSCA